MSLKIPNKIFTESVMTFIDLSSTDDESVATEIIKTRKETTSKAAKKSMQVFGTSSPILPNTNEPTLFNSRTRSSSDSMIFQNEFKQIKLPKLKRSETETNKLKTPLSINSNISASRGTGPQEFHFDSNLKKKLENEHNAQKRLLVQEQLNFTHRCLFKVQNDPNLTLYITDEGLLHYRAVGKSHERNMNINLIEQVLNRIYLIINRSLFENNFFYLTAEGNIFSLYELDKMVSDIYPKTKNLNRIEIKKLLDERKNKIQEILKKLSKIPKEKNSPILIATPKESFFSKAVDGDDSTLEEKEYLDRLTKLSLPATDLEVWTEHTRYYRRILQRLYPSNQNLQEPYPIVSPKTFLFDCIAEIPAVEFFEHFKYLMDLSDIHMPYKQKVCLLNFCKNYALHLGLEQKSSLKLKGREFRLNLCDKTDDPLISNLCEEIESIINKKDRKAQKNIKLIDFHNRLTAITSSKELDMEKVNRLVRIISKDLKWRSANTLIHFTVDSLFSSNEKSKNPQALYFNQLVNFVRNMFLTTIKKYVSLGQVFKGEKVIAFRQEIFNLYSVFLRIGTESLNGHDYLSAMALYAGISMTSLEKLITHKESPKINSELNKMINLKNNIYNTKGDFECLYHKISECQQNKAFCIPYLGAWATKIVHEIEAIEDHAKTNKLTKIEKFALFANEESLLWNKRGQPMHRNIIVQVLEFIEDFRLQFKLYYEDFTYRTNICDEIDKSEDFNEKESDSLFSIVDVFITKAVTKNDK